MDKRILIRLLCLVRYTGLLEVHESLHSPDGQSNKTPKLQLNFKFIMLIVYSECLIKTEYVTGNAALN
jgi:hypothetical protein